MSLKLRASLTISALVVAVVLVLTGFHVFRLWHDLMKNVTDQQLALVTRTAEEIDHKLATSQLQLAGEARGIPPALLADAPRLAGHLAERRSLHAILDTLPVLSPQGTIIADYPEDTGRRGADLSHRDYVFETVARAAPQVSRPFLGKLSGQPVVMVSVPLTDDAGRVYAILAGRLKLNRSNLLGRIAAMRFRNGGHFSLLTRDGVYVMHPERARILRRFDEFEGAVSAIERGLAGREGTSEEFDRHGNALLYSFKRLERYDLMPAIDRWVVRNALAHIERTYEGGGQRRLHTASINLSGASITDPNFLDFVRGELASRRVAAGSICFEITETAAIANLARATQFITALKELGCRFSLDDFGSGMSSFAYLKNLDVDYLKIDGGFVKDMHRDPIDRAMVEAIHRIGNVMGIATIAEFVENDEILELLGRIGVDYVQGYGVARPRPLEELAAAPSQLPRAPSARLAAVA